MVDQKVTLPITGMTCANCAMNIERTVKKLNGIKDANQQTRMLDRLAPRKPRPLGRG